MTDRLREIRERWRDARWNGDDFEDIEVLATALRHSPTDISYLLGVAEAAEWALNACGFGVSKGGGKATDVERGKSMDALRRALEGVHNA